MELYKSSKMNLATCLYFPNQTHLFNMKRQLTILAAFLLVVSFFSILFYEADSIEEYVHSAYMTVASLGIFMSLIDTTFENNAIFILIDIVIGIINERCDKLCIAQFISY